MAYTGTSIVDYLKSIGKPSSFSERTKLAKQYGISGYGGTAAQNTQLLNILRSGQQPTTPAVTPATTKTTGIKEGDTRVNPTTGKTETYGPGGWETKESRQAGNQMPDGTTRKNPTTGQTEVSQGGKWITKTTGTTGTAFTAYGVNIQQGVKPTLEGGKIYFRNPDGSYVWMDADNPLTKQYAPQFYKTTKQASQLWFAYDKNGLRRDFVGTESRFNDWAKKQGYTVSDIPADIARKYRTKQEAENDSAYVEGDTGDGKDAETEQTFMEWLESLPLASLLTGDQKDFMSRVHDYVSDKGTPENIKILMDALSEAETAVDPFWAEQLRIAQTSLTDALAGTTTTYENQAETLENSIEQIEQDLLTGRGRLTLDQQAALAQQKEQYSQQLLGLRDTAAAAGITFSSKRLTGEKKLGESYTHPEYGLMESTKRSYQRRMTDLETEAARGDLGARNQLDFLKEKMQQSTTGLVRGAEQYLGTSNLPSLPSLEGYRPSPMGDISGSWGRERETDIWKLALQKMKSSNPLI